MAQRFPKLTPEEMTAAQREVAAQIAAGPRGEVRGPFIALIHNPELASKVQRLGEQLRWKGKLPPKLKELAVLVTARRWSCDYEWRMHEPIARKAGLEDEIIAAISRGAQPQGLSAEQSAVYAFCRQAHHDGRVEDAVFDAVKASFGLDGALELLCLCGYYSLMAMVLNTAGSPEKSSPA